MTVIPFPTPLPQPREWFLMTYCDCGHARKDHIDDGPCAFIWEYRGALVGCQDRCERMRAMRRG
jgi:hypothetical protein